MNEFQRFQCILSSLYAGVLVVNNEGKIEFANQAFCDLFSLAGEPESLCGLEAHELIQRIKDIYADPAAALDRIQHIVASGEPVKGEKVAIKGGRTYMRDFIPLLVEGRRQGRLWHHQDITDRVREQEELRQEKNRLQALIESMDDEVWFSDSQGQLNMVNSAARKVFGLESRPDSTIKLEELLTLIQAYDQDGHLRTPQDAAMTLALKGETARGETVAHDLRTGRVTYREFCATPILDSEGTITGAVCVVRDIGARKAMEEELKRHREHLEELVKERTLQLEESHQTLKALMEYIPEGITITDGPGDKVRMVSSYGQRLLQKPLNQIDGVPMSEYLAMWDIYHADTMERAAHEELPLIKSARMGENVIDKEIALRKPDGEMMFLLCNAGPICADDGKVLGSVVAWRDITMRRRIEETLAKERNFVENIVGTAQTIILVLDPQGLIIRFNPFFEKISGYRLEEVQGKDWFDTFLPESDRAAIKSLFSQAVNDIQTKGNVYHILTKDGRIREIEWYNKTLRNLDGSLVGLLCTGQDVTDKKAADKKLMQVVAELERSNRELEQFAYVTSHDLQEPLRMVRSFTQLMEEKLQGSLDEEGKEYMAFIIEGVARMYQMIEDILDYSRVATRAKPLTAVDANRALARALDNLAGSIEQAEAAITHDSLPMTNADELQITQVFQNLVGNSLKFRSEERPLIHISALEVDGSWCFSVKDNGIGISQDHHAGIFKLFQRLHSRKKYPGSGIGLAICHKIIERHGGKIWVKSVPGEGSTFYFTLPGAAQERE